MHRFRWVQSDGNPKLEQVALIFAPTSPLPMPNHQVSLAGDQQLHGLGPGESLGFPVFSPSAKASMASSGSECVQHVHALSTDQPLVGMHRTP